MNYYVADGTTQRGPFTEQELAGMTLQPDTLVWHEGMPQWEPAGAMAELRALLAPLVQPLPPQATAAPAPLQPIGYANANYPAYPPFSPADVSGKKLAAGLCGVLLALFGLGAFGIHKFVLGLTGGAVTMLAISLGAIVLGFFTCGVTFLALPIMSLISLIEGIIYLSKSDAEFYQLYIVQKRQWF